MDQVLETIIIKNDEIKEESLVNENEQSKLKK